MSRITGQTSHEEASEKTRTIDIVAVIRCRRREWLGHIRGWTQGADCDRRCSNRQNWNGRDEVRERVAY